MGRSKKQPLPPPHQSLLLLNPRPGTGDAKRAKAAQEAREAAEEAQASLYLFA